MSITIEATAIELAAGSLHVLRSGPRDAPAIVLLHGWPQSARAWTGLMEAAGDDVQLIAPDLPGIGGSRVERPCATTGAVADVVGDLVTALGLEQPVVVGHDVGGMVAYSCLRHVPGLRAVAILGTVVPGVAPWHEVLANPWLWHFAFHTIPGLPEQLASGREEVYFDYFYEAIAHHPERIGRERRRAHADAYRAPGALTAGFDLYRALWDDARVNEEERSAVSTPVLYARGEHEGGSIGAYADGLREAGLTNVRTAVVPDSGHFTPEESPVGLWEVLRTGLPAA
ncbi:alpha/beta fold hydrolase [Actinomyces haliotis]|uniref:alpha/beta fold hydrolase n=1 Tax=Actinomyces haliotis TaxID=1280843 RepID=UPI00188E90A1|nr:alpha/beta hydrolase [Actinomyces haliotis]